MKSDENIGFRAFPFKKMLKVGSWTWGELKWDDRAKVFTVKVGLVMRYESLSFDLRTEVFS